MTATIAPPPVRRPSSPSDTSGTPVVPRGKAWTRPTLTDTAALRGLVKAARPHQWAKNVAVLMVPGLPLFQLGFGGIVAAAGAALAFCLAASSVYLFNDTIDRHNDRHHPTKRNRPIASGVVSPRLAVGTAGVGAAGALAVGWAITPLVAALLLIYLISNAAYSLGLKRVAYLDALILASGFVLRVLAGAAAIAVGAPPLLLVAVFAGATFVALGKRRSELLLLGTDAAAHRHALGSYRMPTLDIAIRNAEGCAVLAFGAWVLVVVGATLGAAMGGIAAVALLSALDSYRHGLGRGKGGNPTLDLISNLAVMGGLGLTAAIALSAGIIR